MPVRDAISGWITGLFDLLLAPFDGHPALALAVMSVGCGVAVMAVFKVVSPQARLRRLRRRFQAHILEIRIYPDEPVLILRALGSALATNVAILRWIALPLLTGAAVVAVLLPQLDVRFARAPLRPGDETVVTAAYRPGTDLLGEGSSLRAGPGATADLAVRVPAAREISWRVRVDRAGAPALTLGAGKGAYRFTLAARTGIRAIGQVRDRSGWSTLVHPGLPRLAEGGPIERIAVRYPPAEYPLAAWDVSWLWAFAFWSLAGAIAARILLRVEW